MTEATQLTGSSSLFRNLSTVYRYFTISQVLRALQLIFAIVVAALYAVDLAHFTNIHAHADADWIYAEVVAAVSALTCLMFSFMNSIHVAWSVLDAVIFVLWLAQVGVFASIFVPRVKTEYAESTLSISRMRTAVWIDLVNMILWLLTAVLRIVWHISARKSARRNSGFKREYAPFLGLLGSRDVHRYSDQEYGCLSDWDGTPKEVDTNMPKKELVGKV